MKERDRVTETIGDRVTKLCSQKGIQFKVLGEMCQISTEYILMIRKGRTPSQKVIRKLASALETNIQYLETGTFPDDIIQPGPKRWVTLNTPQGHQIHIENRTPIRWRLNDHGWIEFSAIADFRVWGVEWR